jgi:uncharacterized protein YbjT (DUF2867 family)
VKELLSSGHKVTDLTRTPEEAQKLQKLGAQARIGVLGQHGKRFGWTPKQAGLLADMDAHFPQARDL